MIEPSAKLPWMKFYPSDWRADACLRVCSLAARGLWMEMLALMHDADGSLLMNGKPMSRRQLASLSGAALDEIESLLSELSDAGVFSIDEDGTIFSRRIRRDLAKAAEDKANGKRGGNPSLKPDKAKPVNGGVNPPNKAQRPEARDQSKSSAPVPPEGVSERETIENRLEAECRKLAVGLPVEVDVNFVPVLKLLDNGLTPDDVIAAMRAIADKNHPLRNWHGVGGWARQAAKERLERAMPPANYARDGPTAGRSPRNGHAPPRRDGRLSPMMNAYKELYNECSYADEETAGEPSWPDASGGGGRVVGRVGGAR